MQQNSTSGFRKKHMRHGSHLKLMEEYGQRKKNKDVTADTLPVSSEQREHTDSGRKMVRNYIR